MVETGKVKALVELARRGPIRARDLEALGIPRAYLKRLRDRGVLERVDRGLYVLADASPTALHMLAQVGKRVPHGVVCLLSALQVHELATEVPGAVWLMLERHARRPTIAYPPLEIVYASGPAFDLGTERHIIEGVQVKITTPAKTVADCFRYRRHVGLEVALEALRDFLAKGRGAPTARKRSLRMYTVDALVEAARADRIYNVLRPYLEALA